MIATIFQLFGVVSMAFLAMLLSSRYLIDVAIGLLRRQQQRLAALRCGLRAFGDEYQRALRHERLEATVMEQ